MLKAHRLPKEQVEARRKAIQDATVKASEVPLNTLDLSVDTLRLAEEVAEVGTSNALSDVATAAATAKAAVEGAASNVMINLPSIEEREYVERTRAQVLGLGREAIGLEERIEKLIQSRSVKAS